MFQVWQKHDYLCLVVTLRLWNMNIITFDIMYCNTFLQIKNGLILNPVTITRVAQPHYKLGLWLIWQNLIQNVNPANIIDQDSMLPGHKEVSKSVLGLISHFSFLHNFVTFLSCFSNSASFASILHEYKALWMLETRQEKDQVLKKSRYLEKSFNNSLPDASPFAV